MNHFKQHVPSCVTGVIPLEFDFETTEDLISHSYLQRYVKNDFVEFAISDNRVLAISDEGYHWWVMGRVTKPEELTLNKWGGVKRRDQKHLKTDIQKQMDEMNAGEMKWHWKMNWCKTNGVAPASGWAWEKAEIAWLEHNTIF